MGKTYEAIDDEMREWIAAQHLFFVATACHGELARRAPDPSRLTGFYLVLSAGGVLGGAAVGVAVGRSAA